MVVRGLPTISLSMSSWRAEPALQQLNDNAQCCPARFLQKGIADKDIAINP